MITKYNDISHNAKGSLENMHNNSYQKNITAECI